VVQSAPGGVGRVLVVNERERAVGRAEGRRPALGEGRHRTAAASVQAPAAQDHAAGSGPRPKERLARRDALRVGVRAGRGTLVDRPRRPTVVARRADVDRARRCRAQRREGAHTRRERLVAWHAEQQQVVWPQVRRGVSGVRNDAARLQGRVPVRRPRKGQRGPTLTRGAQRDGCAELAGAPDNDARHRLSDGDGAGPECQRRAPPSRAP
jgi:hypothetical protein